MILDYYRYQTSYLFHRSRDIRRPKEQHHEINSAFSLHFSRIATTTADPLTNKIFKKF